MDLLQVKTRYILPYTTGTDVTTTLQGRGCVVKGETALATSTNETYTRSGLYCLTTLRAV